MILVLEVSEEAEAMEAPTADVLRMGDATEAVMFPVFGEGKTRLTRTDLRPFSG